MKSLGRMGYVLAAGCLIGVGFASARYLAEPQMAEMPEAALHSDISVTVGSAAVHMNSAFVVPSYLRKRLDNLSLAFDVNTMKPVHPLTSKEYYSAPNMLLVTLLTPDKKRSPAERKAEYLRFQHLAPGSRPHDGGLIYRGFIKDSFFCGRRGRPVSKSA